jgi:hypothetical protein
MTAISAARQASSAPATTATAGESSPEAALSSIIQAASSGSRPSARM